MKYILCCLMLFLVSCKPRELNPGTADCYFNGQEIKFEVADYYMNDGKVELLFKINPPGIADEYILVNPPTLCRVTSKNDR